MRPWLHRSVKSSYIKHNCHETKTVIRARFTIALIVTCGYHLSGISTDGSTYKMTPWLHRFGKSSQRYHASKQHSTWRELHHNDQTFPCTCSIRQQCMGSAVAAGTWHQMVLRVSWFAMMGCRLSQCQQQSFSSSYRHVMWTLKT